MNQPDPSKQNSPPPPSRPSPGRGKQDRNSPTNMIVVVLMIVLIVYMVSTFMGLNTSGNKLTLSEFMEGLSQEPPIYTSENVFELRFGRMEVTFQDRPAPKTNNIFSVKKSGEKTTYYSIPSYALIDLYPELVKLLQKRGIKFTSDSGPSEYSQMVVFAILSLLMLGILWMAFRRVSGTGSAMSFSRSRGRMHAQEDLEVTFDSVAGIDEAVEELREVVEFLRTPGKYQALGGRIPRGVLLVGPPGTGKTLLAKAVAGEAKVPFFSLSGSDFVEMFVGVGAARVRDMFAQAAAKSPSIIFIDELDALGKTRGTGMPGGHDERDQTLNALLVEMDGFSSDQSVIVMAATNRPETLDPALMRPGRFDRHVLVDRPDIKGREAILKVHISKVKLSDDVDLKHLARLTPGFVGADLANLVNEAALLAARKNKTVVTMAEFEEGIERVVAGLEKQTRIIPPDEKLRVAYHECGHALVACSLPMTDPVHKISIIPRGFAALGYTMQRPEEERHLVTQTELQNRICVLLGGLAAEELIFREISSGGQNDLERATDIARRMVMEFGMSRKLGRLNYRPSGRSPFMGTAMVSPADYVHSEETVREIDLETRRIVDEAAKTVKDILTERRAVLEHLSKDLLEKEVMDAPQLQRILDEHAVPKIKPGTYVDEAEKGTAEESGSTPTLRRLDDETEADRTAGA